MPTGIGGEKLWLCPTLDDSANDLSGNSNNGTYNGGMGTVADTSNGGTRCYLFDGANDYIDTGSTSVHQNTVFSYCFWINASSSNTGTDGTVGSYETSGGNRGPLAASTYGTDKLTFFYIENGSAFTAQQTIQTVGDVYDSTWRHVVCEFDGINNTSKVYVDGTLDNTKSSNVPNTVNISTSLKIGLAAGGYTDGRMDDIRVFDRALSTSEITSLASKRGYEVPAVSSGSIPHALSSPFHPLG